MGTLYGKSGLAGWLAVLGILAGSLLGTPARGAGCKPTQWDEIGPFYRPGAPVRSSIGHGYLLAGTVRSAADCSPIPGARIEVWQTGTSGKYDDAHRATLFADGQGRYRLETDFPGGYAQRPSHIHILVDAKGFEGLVTQHYPKKGTKGASFDLVLELEKKEPVKPEDRVRKLIEPSKSR